MYSCRQHPIPSRTIYGFVQMDVRSTNFYLYLFMVGKPLTSGQPKIKTSSLSCFTSHSSLYSLSTQNRGSGMTILYLTREHKVEITSTLKLSTYHAMSFTSDRFLQYWLKSTDFFVQRIMPWPLNSSPRSFHVKKQDEWDDFTQNLPKAGLTTDHVCQALPNLESDDQAEALWLTPTVTAIGTRSDESLAKRAEFRESIGRLSVPPGCLAEQVAISGDTPIQDMRQAWPTPNVSDGYNANLKDGHDIKRGYLRGVVHLWPTPSAQLAGEGKLLDKLLTKDGLPALPNERAYNPNTGRHVQVTLNRAVKLWPEEERPQGQLNPDWVEWLMGFPTLWSVADQEFI